MNAGLAWLLKLEGTHGAYRALLDEHGGKLGLAAHRLAASKLMAQGLSGPPTMSDLRSAAHEIAARAGWILPIPPLRLLVDECALAGLIVVP